MTDRNRKRKAAKRTPGMFILLAAAFFAFCWAAAPAYCLGPFLKHAPEKVETTLQENLFTIKRTWLADAGPGASLEAARKLFSDAGWKELSQSMADELIEGLGRQRARFSFRGTVAHVECMPAAAKGKSMMSISLSFEVDREQRASLLAENLFFYPYGRNMLFKKVESREGTEILQVVRCQDGPDLVLPRAWEGLAAQGWTEASEVRAMRSFSLTPRGVRYLERGRERLFITASPGSGHWTYTFLQAGARAR